MTDIVVCEVEHKRCYPSERTARRASARLSHRIRVYFCCHCHHWHAAKHEQGKR